MIVSFSVFPGLNETLHRFQRFNIHFKSIQTVLMFIAVIRKIYGVGKGTRALTHTTFKANVKQESSLKRT